MNDTEMSIEMDIVEEDTVALYQMSIYIQKKQKC